MISGYFSRLAGRGVSAYDQAVTPGLEPGGWNQDMQRAVRRPRRRQQNRELWGPRLADDLPHIAGKILPRDQIERQAKEPAALRDLDRLHLAPGHAVQEKRRVRLRSRQCCKLA